MTIYIGTSKPTKIYVGTSAVKKVYFGTQLVWSSTETGNWSVGTYSTNVAGGKYKINHVVSVTEKNYGSNTMKVKVVTQLQSPGNYSISSSTKKTGTIKINGTSYSFTYNCSVAAGKTVTLDTRTVTVTGASGKSMALSSSLPFNVNISGYGTIGTVTTSHTVKLPTL